MKPKDKSRESFLSLVGEIFDHGDNIGKTIKSNKRSVSVRSVPSSMLVHSTPSDIHKHGVFDTVCENLNRQFARRAYICYPDESEKRPKLKTATEMCEFYDTVNERNRDIFIKYSNLLCDRVKEVFYRRDTFRIRLTKEARIRFFEYRIKCDEEAAKIDEVHEGLKIEISSRPWKMLKLAALINMFHKASNHELDVDVVDMAIYQTDFFGAYYLKFYSHTEADDVQRVFDHLLSKVEEPILLTTIRDTMSPVSRNKFSRWFLENIPILEQMAFAQGCELVEMKGARNSKCYSLKKILGGS